MYCTQCGSENSPASRFCANCGQAIAPASGDPYNVMPAQSRLSGHIRLLGILWLAESALRLIPGLAMLFIFSAGGAILQHWLPFPFSSLVFLGVPILWGIGALLSLTAVGGLVAGWGLLDRKPWARTLTLILGLLSLPSVPFGTALGVYTLWVLLPAEAEMEYDAASRAQHGATLPSRI